ncbi:MAG: hypothetical protein HY506_00895 [Candidatus Yanofskybacteria bacterium]|nr:hypothetical protein [Candidatus Yanofskybacteria bacterium]
MIQLKVMRARLVLANRELQGVRTPLLRLLSAVLAMFLCVFGMVALMLGFRDLALLVAFMTVGTISAVSGISALNTLQTLKPILLQRRK